ncbi:MAG: hypothetical protein RL670_1223 [Actinomycetota bacterium]|jgi:uncharacterized membrane protein HdeD (DUF308 family)
MRFVLAAKAALSFAAGIVITFSQSHSANVGLLVFGIYAAAYALVVSAVALRFEPARFLVDELSLVILAATISCFALLNLNSDKATFALLVAIWGLVSAGYELLAARRSRPSGLKNREQLISASMALLLAGLFLFVPLDVVSAVGFFGAYLVLSSVHLGIAAFSPKV